MFKINKTNFLSDLHEQSIISSYYKAIKYSFKAKHVVCQNNNKNSIKKEKPLVSTIIAFPKFLSPVFQNKNQVRVRRVIQEKLDCYGIKLDENYKDVDLLLKTYLPHTFRSNLKRLKKRLEICFPIEYKMYFGHIQEEEYYYIIDSLFKLQTARINHKKINNNLAYKYDHYRNIIFSLINNNKASLFVIYNNNTPIGVTLNFHFEKIFFGTLTSFDMDYSKFGIGNLLIYKQLDWCVENSYDYFDMGNGDFDYKKRWSNHHYLLETHIISPKNNILANSISIAMKSFIILKNILKKMNFDTLLDKIKTAKQQIEVNKKQLSYTFEDISINKETEKMSKISLSDLKYSNIKKPVFDFLYSNQEHIDNTSIYCLSNESNQFIIKGKNKTVKCVLEDTGT